MKFRKRLLVLSGLVVIISYSWTVTGYSASEELPEKEKGDVARILDSIGGVLQKIVDATNARVNTSGKEDSLGASEIPPPSKPKPGLHLLVEDREWTGPYIGAGFEGSLPFCFMKCRKHYAPQAPSGR